MSCIRPDALPRETVFRDYAEEFVLSLHGAGRSHRTMEAYLYALRGLEAFLVASGQDADPLNVSPLLIERWLADRREAKSAANAGFIHRSARPFFRWLVTRGYVEAGHNPFSAVASPKVPIRTLPVLTDDDVRAILHACDGSDWRARRDRALVRVLLDTGMRRGEVAGLRVEDVDLAGGVIHVRARSAVVSRNRLTDSGALFIGFRATPLTGWGLWQVMKRRCGQANVQSERLMHVWRHYWASSALASGVGELDVQVLGGWRSLAMVGRYTAANREERALAGHARWSPGDRL
jgi:integrase